MSGDAMRRHCFRFGRPWIDVAFAVMFLSRGTISRETTRRREGAQAQMRARWCSKREARRTSEPSPAMSH